MRILQFVFFPSCRIISAFKEHSGKFRPELQYTKARKNSVRTKNTQGAAFLEHTPKIDEVLKLECVKGANMWILN